MSRFYSSLSSPLTSWTLTSPHSTSIFPLPYQRLLLLLLLHASPAILLQLLPVPVPGTTTSTSTSDYYFHQFYQQPSFHSFHIVILHQLSKKTEKEEKEKGSVIKPLFLLLLQLFVSTDSEFALIYPILSA